MDLAFLGRTGARFPTFLTPGQPGVDRGSQPDRDTCLASHHLTGKKLLWVIPGGFFFSAFRLTNSA